MLTWIVIFLREIPAFWFLGLWFLYQLYFSNFALARPEQGGGVAFFAHIGGFAFGLATGLLLLVAQRRPRVPPPRHATW